MALDLMKFEFHDPKIVSLLGFPDDIKKFENYFLINKGNISILWNRNKKTLEIEIDGQWVELLPDQLITTTYLQHVTNKKSAFVLTVLLFNWEFHYIRDHDSEVSCHGILFFGTQDLPIITVPSDQQRKFNTLNKVFENEFSTPDRIKGDMLQLLLKRLIITCTRLAKEQQIVQKLKNDQVEIIRKFNVLVDSHYWTKRKVSDYAELFAQNKSTN